MIKRIIFSVIIAGLMIPILNTVNAAEVTDLETSITATNKTQGKDATKVQNMPGDIIEFRAFVKNPEDSEVEDYEMKVYFKGISDYIIFQDKAGGTFDNGALEFPETNLDEDEHVIKNIRIKIRSDKSTALLGHVFFGNASIPLSFQPKDTQDLKIKTTLELLNESDGTNPSSIPVNIGESIRVSVGISGESDNPTELENYYIKVFAGDLMKNGDIDYISGGGKVEGEYVVFGPINQKAFCDFSNNYFFRINAKKCDPEVGKITFFDLERSYTVYCKKLPKTGPGETISLVLAFLAALFIVGIKPVFARIRK